jgi:hypothetical protein
VKADRIHSFGPPDVVVVEDVDMPSPGPGFQMLSVKQNAEHLYLRYQRTGGHAADGAEQDSRFGKGLK